MSLTFLLALAACLGIAAIYLDPARLGLANLRSLAVAEGGLAETRQRLDAAEQELARITASLAELAAQAASRPGAAGQDTRTAIRISEVEARAEAGEAALRKQAGILATHLATLEGDLEDARAASDAGAGKVADLEKNLTQLAAHPALARAALPGVQPESVTALAAGQLEILVRTGRPYGAAAERLRALSGKDRKIAAALEQLAPGAATGIPSRASLKARFQELLGELSAGTKSEGKPGILEGVTAKIRGLLRIRRTDAASAAPVTRAERALARGDLGAVVAALEGFGPMVEAWRRDARLRVAAETALATLHDRIIALLDAAVESERSATTKPATKRR